MKSYKGSSALSNSMVFVHTHVGTNVKYYFIFFKGVRDLWVENVSSESLYLCRENKLVVRKEMTRLLKLNSRLIIMVWK